MKITPLGPDVYKNVQPNKGMVRIYINLLCRLLKNEVNIVWRIDQSIMGPQAAELAEEMVGAIKVHNKKQLIVFE